MLEIKHLSYRVVGADGAVDILQDVSLTVEGEPIAEFRGTFRVIPSQRGAR